MKKWVDLLHEEAKEKVTSLLDFFEPVIENTDPSNLSFRLKKPVNKLTEEEKETIRVLLKETFENINDEDIKKFLK